MAYRKDIAIPIINVTFNPITHPPLTQKIYLSDSRAVFRYAQHSYTFYCFRFMSVSTHKMAYWKEGGMCVWMHNSPVVSHIQF